MCAKFFKQIIIIFHLSINRTRNILKPYIDRMPIHSTVEAIEKEAIVAAIQAKRVLQSKISEKKNLATKAQLKQFDPEKPKKQRKKKEEE